MKRFIYIPMAFLLFAGGVVTGLRLASVQAPVFAQSGCQTFQATGKTVCGRFLQYWQTHGGLAQQGYQLSGEFTEVSDLNGKPYTVQYFERAVFEKHPENAAPNDVLLSQLGTFQFKAKYGGVDPSDNQPPAPTQPPAPVGPKLDILEYRTYMDPLNIALYVVGVAKNTGSAQLGRIKIVITLKNAQGGVVATTNDYERAGSRPGELVPFYTNFYGQKPVFSTVEFQTEVDEASSSEKDSFYGDYQINNVTTQPATNYKGVTVLGTVKNTGSATSADPSICVIARDDAGKLIDVNSSRSSLSTIAAGQSSPFDVILPGTKTTPHLDFVVRGEKK